MSLSDDSSLALLDLPPDARVLLINCDDLGLHEAANSGILEAIDHGIATSSSLMVPAAGSAAALDLLTARPDIDVGVHLSLISDFPDRPTAPIADAASVPSLVDDSGHFIAQGAIPDLLERADLADVRREIDAQLTAVLEHGVRPSHLDWHCLADGGRPDILDATRELAAAHGLAVRVWLDPARDDARRSGRPVIDHPFVDSFALDPATKQETLERALRSLPTGLTEWAVHPSTDSPLLRETDTGWPVRTSDLAFLTSERAAAVLAEEGIVTIDYRPVQRAWAAAVA